MTSTRFLSPFFRFAPVVSAALLTTAGCGQVRGPAGNTSDVTLSVGFGLSLGDSAEAGIQQAIRNITQEALVFFSRDGRAQPWLAEGWAHSADRLRWQLQIKSGVTSHDKNPLTAEVVRGILAQQLPLRMGPAFADIASIQATSDREVELSLIRPSAFLIEGLDLAVAPQDAPSFGTGPFYVASTEPLATEMMANQDYHGGKPLIDRIIFKPYVSVRSAWADLLRGQVDMLYEVGTDAIDLMQPSSSTEIFTAIRPYAYVVIFNVNKPLLRSRDFRQTLNRAIDRSAVVTQALKGYGEPADTPVWPHHWAYDPEQPRFKYDPQPITAGGQRVRLNCLFVDAADERIALVIQQQLQAVGVDLEFEKVELKPFFERVEAGGFDLILATAQMGPTMLRPYQFWRTAAPRNWGKYSNPATDAAFDAIRDASSEAEYRAGVSRLQSALIEDPPAIFLAWSERARAVSTRFEVPVEPGRDILSTLRLWRPAADRSMARPN